jgi:hypothetical protein
MGLILASRSNHSSAGKPLPVTFALVDRHMRLVEQGLAYPLQM